MALMFILLLLHAYVGWRLIAALDFAPPLQWLLGALLLASWLLMPLALLARRIRRQPLSDRLAWTGLLLMGLFSSLFVLTLLRDVLALPLWVASFWWPLPGWLVPASAAAVPALAALLTLWGLVNARRTAQVVRVDVPIASLPAALHGFSIAQISDVHVGPTIKRGYLQAIVERINALQRRHGGRHRRPGRRHGAGPGPPRGAAGRRWRSRHGTFFVTGNHEYYSGADAWVDELQPPGPARADERACAAAAMARPRWRWPAWPTSARTTSTHRTAATRRPPSPACPTRRWCACCWRTSRAVRRRRRTAGFHLQLSGHTHGGQFLPWNFLVRLQQPFTAGLNRWQDLWVYTSRGTGYWGPPKRLGAPSEITHLRLVTA